MKLEIDYSSHPAFKSIARHQHLPEAHQYFRALDELWAEMIAPRVGLTANKVIVEFDRRSSLLRFSLMEALARADIQPDYLPYVARAIDNSLLAIRAEIAQIIEGRNFRQAVSRPAASISDQLHENGVAAFRIERGIREKIFNSLEPYVQQVNAQCGLGTGERCFVAVPARGVHWDLLKSFVQDNHIESAISAFAGFPLELVGYALTLSHPAETWYKICYQDLAMSEARTVQQHYDQDNLSAKSMFYLNDVDLDNGPFTYITNSRDFISFRSQTSFFKYLDYAGNDFSIAQKSPATIYNRPMFANPALRRAFASLPVELRGSSCPGDDVIDSTPLSEALLKAERPLTSEDGDLLLFAGGETIHRGGVTRKGQRYALQMMYKRPQTVMEKLTNFPTRMGSRAKRMLLSK